MSATHSTRHYPKRYLPAAADGRLTPDEMATLDAALAPEKIAGPRYGPAQMAQVDR